MEFIQLQDDYLSFRTQEAYKTLRTNIEFSRANVHTVAVTSCTPNEGKSEVSFELAKSFAQNNNRVLLIDADLRKSVMWEHFKAGRVRFGLSNYLVGGCSMSQCICRTDMAGFYMIFSGPVVMTPSELLGGERFCQLLKDAGKYYKYVIVDTPPLGSVIDSAIVGKQCDGTVLVISSGAVSYRFAQNVKRQLDQADCHVLGCVLNKVDMSGSGAYGRYYGKYYGKYYGDYGNEEEDA